MDKDKKCTKVIKEPKEKEIPVIIADARQVKFSSLTDDQRISVVAEQVLNRYLPAFEELADG